MVRVALGGKPVVVEQVWLTTAGDVEIEEPVAVVIRPGGGGAIGPRLQVDHHTRVAERTIAVVTEESVRGIRIAHVEVEKTVVIVIAPGGGAADAGVGDARRPGNVRERAISVVVEEGRRLTTGDIGGIGNIADKEIEIAVIVIIAPDGHTGGVPGHTGRVGHVGEGDVFSDRPIGVIQGVPVLGDDEEVRPTIVVVVGPGRAGLGTDGGGQPRGNQDESVALLIAI